MASPSIKKDMYDYVSVDTTKPVERFQLIIEPHEVGRFVGRKPRPKFLPNKDAESAHTEMKKKIKEKDSLVDDVFWWNSWFLYLSKKQIDRDDMRDLILSKLPVGKLFAVGCVPQYSPYLFNAHVNPFLEPHLQHNAEYYPSAFCVREGELDSLGILHDVPPRQVLAYQIARERWVKFPTLDFLPPRVNQMLAGEGGLLLLCGDPPPWVDPFAPEEPLVDVTPAELPKEEKKTEGEEGEEGEPDEAEGGGDGEEGEEGEEKPKKEEEKPLEKTPEKPIDPNGQKLIVVCNPIARTFRILPPMHCHLESLLGHIALSDMSDEYVVYIVGYHPLIGQCPEHEGLRVAVFKSKKGRWRVFMVPQGKLYRPGLSNYNRALPLITKDVDGTTVFCSGQVVTPQQGVVVPVILGFRKKKRCWTAYSWPPASEVEAPQLVECNGKLYIVARGPTETTTMTVWTFVYHEFSVPDCKQVTKMPSELFSKVFPFGYRVGSEFDCCSSVDSISFTCRERPTTVACYNVKRNKWCELPLYPNWIEGLTFLGNWRFEPAAHAQV